MTEAETITSHWNRVEHWLSQQAPDVLRSLKPGAAATQIRKTERVLGIKFPADVVASYLLHDGQERYGEGLFQRRWSLLSMNGIVSEWQGWVSLAGDGEAYWHQLWIPIAHDFGGNNYSIDLDPRLGNDVGRIIHTNHEMIPEIEEVVADNFQSLLLQLADDMESREHGIQA